jgi:hypothetical protein
MRAASHVRRHGLQQAFLRERLRQVLVGADHPTAGAVEKAVFRREHDHRHRVETAVFLDQRTGLVTVEPRHHDVDEDQFRLVVGDFRESIKAILRQDHRASRLQQEDFRAAANGVRVVDHHHLDALQRASADIVAHRRSVDPAACGLAPSGPSPTVPRAGRLA